MNCRVKFIPADMSINNPDVLSLYAELLAGNRFSRKFGGCPVCGNDKANLGIVCLRPYCKQVWRTAKALYKLAPKLDDDQPDDDAPKPKRKYKSRAKTVPVVVETETVLSETDRWMRDHALVTCERMSARLASSSCGKNWRCFEPSRCERVPAGTPCPVQPTKWGE